jgi:hypothetical protein
MKGYKTGFQMGVSTDDDLNQKLQTLDFYGALNFSYEKMLLAPLSLVCKLLGDARWVL